MEKPPNTNEGAPRDVSKEFNEMDSVDFSFFIKTTLRKDPSARFTIITSWPGLQKVRAAKALNDNRDSYHIDSITIRATRAEFEEDVNAFQSGVKWEEVK